MKFIIKHIPSGEHWPYLDFSHTTPENPFLGTKNLATQFDSIEEAENKIAGQKYEKTCVIEELDNN